MTRPLPSAVRCARAAGGAAFGPAGGARGSAGAARGPTRATLAPAGAAPASTGGARPGSGPRVATLGPSRRRPLRRGALLAAVLLAAGCATAPRTLEDDLAAAREAGAHARHGWLAYLAGDAAAARASFERVPGDPLAALGAARLARDALDASGALTAAARAVASGRDRARLDADASGASSAAAPAWTGVVARLWAQEAADELPEGAARLARVLGTETRVPVQAQAYTVRVSFLPYLDLRRLLGKGPVIEGENVRVLGELRPLAATPPAPDRDGLVLTVWPLPDGPASLEARVGGPMIAWRGERVVLATALDRVAPGTLRFDAPGRGPLVTVWAAPELPRLWRWTTPTPGGVDPGDRVAAAIRAEAALLDGDTETAHALIDGAPDTPGYASMRARLAAADTGLPAGAARDLARAGWNAARPLAPALAHLELARIDRAAGDVAAARAHLDALAALAPDAHVAHQERFRLDLDSGWRDDAGDALAAALRTAPDPCRLLDEQDAWLQAREDARGRASLVDVYVGCDKPIDAVELLLDLGRAGDALQRLDACSADAAPAGDGPGAAPGPAATSVGAAAAPACGAHWDERRARRARARALLALGRTDEALAALEKDADTHWQLRAADLAGARDPAKLADALRGLVGRHPTSREGIELVAAWPEWSPFATLALDTEQVIAAFESEPPLPGPAVRVLEHTAILYYADGRSLRRVHEILAIRSREAAETFGEIGLPDGVRTVALYTRKADGRLLYAEESPEKETVSMPDLAAGDYVVAVYLKGGDNGYLYDRGFLTPRIWFRSTELPIFRQRFEVFSPDDKPPVVQTLAGAPAPSAITLAGRAGLRFDVRQVALFAREPDPAPATHWLPSVRAGRGTTLADDLDYVRDRTLFRRRRTARFESWVHATAGEGDDRTRALRLARAVRERVDDQVGLVEDDAPAMLESGHGNRALVLSAALETAEIEHTLLLARPAVHDPEGPFAQVADYPYPLIRFGAGADAWWLDPGPDRAPPGFLGASMLGGDAVPLWPPAGDVEPLPTTRAVADARAVELDLRWRADGVIEGTVVDHIEGQEAIVIGTYLSRLDPNLRASLMERLLVPVVGAAKVTSFDDPVGQQDPDGPLTLRYRFEARAGDRLDLGLFPASPGRTWAALPERQTPLLIELPTDTRVTVTVTSERPLHVTPRPGRYAEARHRYVLAVEPGEDRVRFTSHLQIAGGAIDPEAYLRFADWARRVDAAERVQLRAGP